MEKQIIDLRGIEIKGRVLDIGGGGEGIVARHIGERVVAIDHLLCELEETQDIGIKIVMDAGDMSFVDNLFDNATCFYSIMYMSDETLGKVFNECYRVLKNDGYLWIWDTVIPESYDEEVFIVQMQAKLDHEEVSAGFGIGWNRGQSLESVLKLLNDAGFKHVQSESDGEKIYIKVQK